MSIEMIIGLVGIIILCVLIFLKIWIGAALGIIGFLGYGFLVGWDMALNIIGREPYQQASSYNMSAIPLFVFMGMLVANTGIAEDMYTAFSKWIGHIRGGLAMASALACGVFAAVTAGNLEATLAMSKIAFPEMKKYKYADSLAAGSIAAGGTIGSLIPPSVAFIIYGLLTETSVGKLFMAGIIPGIIEIVSYIIVIYLICLYNPKMAEIVPKVVFKEKLVSLKAILPMLCLFLFIFGGIYGGIFTPTEAAALGALGAIIITVAWRKLKRENLLSSLKEALTITAAILMIMIGAYIFMRFMTVSQLPAQLGKYIVSFNLSHVLTMLLIAVFYLVAGCFLNTIAIMLLTVPIIYPLVQALGYDLIWFGVIMVRLMEIGMISPPIGINVFITSKATGLPVSTVYKGILPFVLADILNVVLLIAIPQISLFLPNLM